MTSRGTIAEIAARLLPDLTTLVIRAGLAILDVSRDTLGVTDKADGSPVTLADLASDRVLQEGLQQLAPDIPVVSEESSHGEPMGDRAHFLIDPLDGTTEFIAGRDEYTVNLALVDRGTPVLGIVSAPAGHVLWRGIAGRGAERLALGPDGSVVAVAAITTRPFPGHGWVAAVSRSHADAASEAFIDARPGATRLRCGSSVKLGRIAEGAADIYPRLGPTSEWDIAAGHAVVGAAGGRMTDPAGQPLLYGRNPRHRVPGFIAWGDPKLVVHPV